MEEVEVDEVRLPVERAARIATILPPVDLTANGGAASRWIDPLLSTEEHAGVRSAVAEAIADLRARGDARVVDLLATHVWTTALRRAA